MFGIDILNSVPVSHLLMGESITFNATEFDRDPSAGYEGKYATVNWDASIGKYQVTVDGETKSTSYGDGRADFLRDFGQFIHGFKNYGVKYDSLSPSDSTGTEVPTINTPEETEDGTGNGGTPKDCSLENREAVAGDTDSCGSCLSGYTEDETGVCVADEVSSEDFNWLLPVGVISVVGFLYSFMIMR